MINIENLINTIKSNKKIAILAVVIILLGIGFYIYSTQNYKQNEQTVVENVAKVDISKSINIPLIFRDKVTKTIYLNPSLATFVAEKMPKQVAIYEFQPSDFFSDANIRNLLQAINAGQVREHDTPTQGKILSTITDSASAFAYFKDESFIYQKNSADDSATEMLSLEPSTYEKKAYELLKSYGFPVENYTNKAFTYYRADGGKYLIRDTKDDCQFIEITYSATLGEYPISAKLRAAQPDYIKIMINNKMDIQRIIYTNSGTPGKKIADISLKDYNAIANAVVAKEIYLVNLEGITVDNLVSSTLNDIKIFYINLENKLVPVYVFDSLSRDESSNSYRTEYLMDAINRNQ